MQVSSVDFCMRLYCWCYAPLHCTCSNSNHQMELLAILKEFMDSHGYFRMPESLLPEVLMMPLPTTVWRNSSDICLQEGRPEEFGAAAKSQC